MLFGGEGTVADHAQGYRHGVDSELAVLASGQRVYAATVQAREEVRAGGKLTCSTGLAAGQPVAWLVAAVLFYPEPGSPITPARAGLEYRDVELRAADGTRLHAWWLPAKAGLKVRGTILHLHGNGGDLAWHLGACTGCRSRAIRC